MPRHKVPASLLSCSLLGLERLTAAGALGCCEAVVRTHRGHLEDSSTGFETKEMVEASASKRSIRRFVITEKAPTSRPSLMIIGLRTQFHVGRPWGQHPFSIVS